MGNTKFPMENNKNRTSKKLDNIFDLAKVDKVEAQKLLALTLEGSVG